MSFEPVPLFNDNDVADLERMNNIIGNINELNANRIITNFSTPELLATRNLKVSAGRVDFAPGRSIVTEEVSFNGFFENLVCKPVVTATLAATTKRRSFVTISNVDNVGFTITVETASGEPFQTGFSVHYSAFGF
jgi:hypothetical protein